ncbi:hypothetical protein [Clostridium perfringens]|nr:hypothetical protein [Clostridium perfringens]
MVTQFGCKSCKEIYKSKGEHCVPEDIKSKAVAMTQTRELL